MSADEAARAVTRGMVEKLRDELVKEGMQDEATALGRAADAKLGSSADLLRRYGDALTEIADLLGLDTREPTFDPLDALDAARSALARPDE